MKRNFKIINKNKRAQVTIFIIIAIAIVASIALYFSLKGKFIEKEMPKELSPVYAYFLSCIEDETQRVALLMGSQGGYLEVPEFSPGSEFAPFSSQLDFLGTPVPYWYYVSGNSIAKEQIPSKTLMESQLEDYLNENLDCNFASFEQQGFEIEINEEVNADVKIQDNKIDVSVDIPLTISFDEVSALKENHKVSINSRLGTFYNIAKKIYDKEQKDLFLENYGVDVLRLYMPVDGVELSCSPKVWLQDEIKKEFMIALENNVQAIKIKGSYYTLAEKENTYFVQDLGEERVNQGENINFLYSAAWPTKIEVYPEDDPMIAEPVGNQAGLGILGFCYVPYHFVYDIAYPVLIQIYNSEEVFQFPVGVVIDKNLPRKGLEGEAVQDAEPELCKYKNQEVEVYTYDVEIEPVEADIDFECLTQRCNIGKTKLTENGDAYLSKKMPQCANGFIVAEADGYARKRSQASTNTENSFNIILDKLHNLIVELQVDGKATSDSAIIDFVSPDNSKSISYPAQREISLSEGQYDVRVYVYRNSSIKIPGMKDEKCVESPKPGLFGLFGATEEKCFTIDLPAQELVNVISGGGKGQDYLVESELKKGKMIIKVESIQLPKSLGELQDSYNLIEVQGVYLEFENA